ncbi:Putative cytochrome P450 [Colletotrichum destructivum]|uniref:Cytochrome P450 n=1 Tax=Colletotrichum destructivum TaxID=34406 RepID=A0AAX4I7W4_9PEZI|nr:Putative cytochrome P450 [Colletotrichum destructivum]
MAASTPLDITPLIQINSPVTIGILVVVFAYVLYLWALPKPIPGLPCDPDASSSLLGSVPSMLRLQSETGATFVDYMIHQSKKLDSPIFQVFLGPLTRPHVVVADFRESQDILLRRREFDRAVESMRSVFAGMIPHHHIHMKTDATWKAHRYLLQDMLLPAVMSSVAGPAIYANTTELITLWRLKAQIGGGRPFDAHKDVFQGALDAILGVAFGKSFQHHAIRPKVDLLRSLDKAEIARLGLDATSDNLDEPVDFPEGPKDKVIAAILDLADSLDGMPAAAFPTLKWAWLSRTPQLRRAIKDKRDFIVREIETALERQKTGKAETDKRAPVRSAVDLMVRKEKELAEKGNRQPQYLSPVMIDEIFGFIVAGHDTTSTTVNWGVKILADHPEITRRLRAALQQCHHRAVAENRNPTADEIQTSRIPYLEATMEELLRCAGTTPSVDRVALADTEVLGHPISKGTMVMMLGTGPSMLQPGFEIPEAKRSPTAQAAKKEGKARAWDHGDIAAFRPERWLAADGIEFDATAGPQLSFGLGGRSCFGKKLAYLELRIIVTLIVWNFELLPCPEKLSGYASIIGITNKPLECYVRLKDVKLGEGV